MSLEDTGQFNAVHPLTTEIINQVNYLGWGRIVFTCHDVDKTKAIINPVKYPDDS